MESPKVVREMEDQQLEELPCNPAGKMRSLMPDQARRRCLGERQDDETLCTIKVAVGSHLFE
jgi:hypothetical protein